ncbi:chorismate mutase [Candidatus Clostridium radicumherbarum]|uniref:chorismate mutase n=1 Tax=Candidatus Clostridium radicumherbarum TaxID=3381662 RepID=A0ABW8TS84_9CLOT
MIAIRGATTINEDNIDEVREAAIELFNEIIKENDIETKDIISIIFSCTGDIKSTYPGKYIREHFELNKVAIMHFNEMDVNNSLKKCIRVMLHVNIDKNKEIKYIYLNNAKILRQDLIN